jgi:arylsulfatase A-like enzyme
MKRNLSYNGLSLLMATAALFSAVVPAQAADKKPNILFIMGDDVGWFNVGAYHQGIMSGKTPNLDRLAREGVRFTDYYAEASCTAGRANFITGELPIRTGLTTVGQAGADVRPVSVTWQMRHAHALYATALVGVCALTLTLLYPTGRPQERCDCRLRRL